MIQLYDDNVKKRIYYLNYFVLHYYMSVNKRQRPQIKWNIHNDNSVLSCHPTQIQINNVHNFRQNIHQQYHNFMSISLQIAPKVSRSILQHVNQYRKFKQLLITINQKGYVFLDLVTDFASSYRGWISWVIVAFNNEGYLIDGLALHNQLKQIKDVLESPKIIKYCFSETIILNDAKRDWSAFGVNFFNFQFFNNSNHPRQRVTQIARIPDYPISCQVLEELQLRYDSMIQNMNGIESFFKQWPQQFPAYYYTNHDDLVLEPYQHKPATFEQQRKDFQQEMKYLRREQKQNHHELGDDILNCAQIEGGNSVFNKRNQKLCKLLYEWREHKAKIMDYPPTRLLNVKQVLQIVQKRPKSYNKMQEILNSKEPFYLQVIQQIIQILTLQAQKFQDQVNSLQVQDPLPKNQQRIRKILQELQWQNGQQWLNRKNDESIRLYKEIISIQELDDSVIEEFMNGMSSGSGVVGKAQINRFVKYAQLLKRADHRKLHEYYQINPKLQKQNGTKDQKEDWNNQDQNISNINQTKSQTSVADLIDKDYDKIECRTNSSTNFDCKVFSSHNMNDLPNLAKNIQQIYRKGAEVKKNYQKIQKKKSNRRDSGQENEALVPSWQQLKYFLSVCD